MSKLKCGSKSKGYKKSYFNQVQLKKGTKIEMEHTCNPKQAERIAMDHLVEHPDYYIELEKMEKKLKRKGRVKK